MLFMIRPTRPKLDTKMRRHEWIRRLLIVSIIMVVAETFAAATNAAELGNMLSELIQSKKDLSEILGDYPQHNSKPKTSHKKLG